MEEELHGAGKQLVHQLLHLGQLDLKITKNIEVSWGLHLGQVDLKSTQNIEASASSKLIVYCF